MNKYRIIEGDCREGLKQIADNSVHTCITSPPYFGLRSYENRELVKLREDLSEEEIDIVVGELQRLGIKPIA